MLHIHNGDSSANTLREFGLDGDYLAWREAYVSGPTPSGLDSDEWHNVRAEFLTQMSSTDEARCRNELIEQQKRLNDFSDHEEVVLWFEHDIHCQTVLIYLLDWLSRQDLGETKLSLICIDRFPGIEDFRGLGQLNGSQMASLFPSRQPITADHLALGSRAWAASCSADPTSIERLINRKTDALSFLANALLAHLSRFPSVENGLGSVQQKSLELISSGKTNFSSLFGSFSAADPVLAGMGDLSVWIDIDRMSSVKEPLLTIDRSTAGNGSNAGYADASLHVTATGSDVLSGSADFVRLNGIDQWLGGVHLQGQQASWRWDTLNKQLVSL